MKMSFLKSVLCSLAICVWGGYLTSCTVYSGGVSDSPAPGLESSSSSSSSSSSGGGSSGATSITAVTYTVGTDGAGSMTSTSSTDNANLIIFSNSEITIKTAAGSKPKLDNSKYVQFNTLETEFDALVITVSAPCTATFTLNAAGNTSGKAYSLNGISLTKETSYYTKDVSLPSGTTTLKGSGFKFSKIAFK